MNRSREIKNQISQIGLQRTYARQQVDVQVRSALNDLLTARETMYAQELTVEQARKAYSISDTRYRAGAGTILELNSAQLAQTQAQARTMAQADKAYHISDTRFRAGAGTILELNSAQLNRTQAHLNYSQAIYDYLTAKAEYDRIVGKEK